MSLTTDKAHVICWHFSPKQAPWVDTLYFRQIFTGSIALLCSLIIIFTYA